MSRRTTVGRNAIGLSAVGALAEQTRRAVYEYVVKVGDWVSRDQAADGVGLERGTASHHLDRLTADGLLDVTFQRLTGRQGPGAGRPAKLYRRSANEFEVSLPGRDYELAGQLLAEAVERALVDGVDINDAVERSARDEGRRIGEALNARLGVKKKRRAQLRAAVLETLTEHGYEPHEDDDGVVVLHNCPFHQLAQQHTELICGMNLCLVSTAIEQIDGVELSAHLDPQEGQCCVKLSAS